MRLTHPQMSPRIELLDGPSGGARVFAGSGLKEGEVVRVPRLIFPDHGVSFDSYKLHQDNKVWFGTYVRKEQ